MCRAPCRGGQRLSRRAAPSGQTALMRAAAKGHAETIRLLLGHEGRSDPNARGGERLKGATALYLSAQSGHTQGVKALLAGGAHADAALEEMGVTPLFVAAERGHVLTAEALMLEGGADWQRTNWNGIDAWLRSGESRRDGIDPSKGGDGGGGGGGGSGTQDDGQGAAHGERAYASGKARPIQSSTRCGVAPTTDRPA